MSANIITVDQLKDAVNDISQNRIAVIVPPCVDVDAALLSKATNIAAASGAATIVCATRGHAATLAERAPEGVRVAYVADLALEHLANPAVQEKTLRSDRVLDDNEMDILVEDVKVTGLKMKRLKEMLKFFYRSISDLTAEKEGWLISDEEARVYAVLEENLEARRACMPYELAAKAYQGLTAAGIKPEPTPLLVDDFGALSASSQRLLEYLSDGRIVAFGSDAFFLCSDEPYPSPEGMRAFIADERTTVIEVETPAAEQMPVVTLPNPLQEFEDVAGQISRLVANGLDPHQITVAAPNGTWCKQVAQELAKQNIPYVLDQRPRKVKGDPRETEFSSGIKLAAFAKLLANPDDFTALRTYVGVGDWLVGSDGFLELLAFARDHRMDAPSAMREMAQPEYAEIVTVSFKKFIRPLQEYDNLCATWNTGTVAEVCAAMERGGMPLGKRAGVLGEPDDRPDIDAFLATFAEKPAPSFTQGVTIAPYERTHTHPCEVLIIMGMVDGFMPKRDAVDDAFDIEHRNIALARDRRVLQSMEAIARDRIYYTSFDHDAIENCAAMHMVTTRIYQKGDRRMARVSPSALMH